MRRCLVDQNLRAFNSTRFAACSPLELCLDRVRRCAAAHRARQDVEAHLMCADDAFKIAALIDPKDSVLQLQKDVEFVLGIHVLAKQLSEVASTNEMRKAEGKRTVVPLTAFQQSFIDGAFAKAGIDVHALEKAANSSTSTMVNDVGDESGHPSSLTASTSHGVIMSPALEYIAAIGDVVYQARDSSFIGGDDMRKVQRHCDSLKPFLRQLDGLQNAKLAKLLAIVHYKDYDFASIVARRGCETASQLPADKCCQLVFNLVKLNVQDTMVALMNKIEADVQNISAQGAFLLFQALERQGNPSAIARKVLPKVAARCPQFLPDATSPTFHRSFIVAMGRYGLSNHPSVGSVVKDLKRFSDQISDRDLVPLIQCFADAKLPAHTDGVAEVFQKLEGRLPQFDIRMIDAVIDVLSTLPCSNNAAMMDIIMQRLQQDCGKLSCHQMVTVLELMVQYPAAKDHECLDQMGFVVSATKEAYEPDGLQRIIVALASAKKYSADFCAICEFAQTSRNGIAKSFERLMQFLNCLTAEACSEPRLLRIVIRAVDDAATHVNNDEVIALQKEIKRLNIQHPALQQKLIGRLRALQREAGEKKNRRYRRGYDPVDDLL